MAKQVVAFGRRMSERKAFVMFLFLTPTGWGVIGSVLFVLAFCAAPFVSVGEGYSDGERIGVITKLSKKGVVNKTWEGTLQASGNDVSGLNTFEFSTLNDKVAEEISEAADEGKRVKLIYSQYLFRGAYVAGTKYEVTKVEVMK